jgi:hypothetical protein
MLGRQVSPLSSLRPSSQRCGQSREQLSAETYKARSLHIEHQASTQSWAKGDGKPSNQSGTADHGSASDQVKCIFSRLLTRTEYALLGM